LEEETIEVTFNSKSIQLKIKKNCNTSLIDAKCIRRLAEFLTPLSAYLLWMQAEIKSSHSISPVEPMVPNKAPVY